MAAPEEIRPLADYLYKNGYNVYGVRLRGHGTAPEDLAIRSWQKWYNSASRAYIIMKTALRLSPSADFPWVAESLCCRLPISRVDLSE